jgi:hypothetical protein
MPAPPTSDANSTAGTTNDCSRSPPKRAGSWSPSTFADFARITTEWAAANRSHGGALLIVGIDHREFGLILRVIDHAPLRPAPAKLPGSTTPRGEPGPRSRYRTRPNPNTEPTRPAGRRHKDARPGRVAPAPPAAVVSPRRGAGPVRGARTGGGADRGRVLIVSLERLVGALRTAAGTAHRPGLNAADASHR